MFRLTHGQISTTSIVLSAVAYDRSSDEVPAQDAQEAPLHHLWRQAFEAECPLLPYAFEDGPGAETEMNAQAELFEPTLTQKFWEFDKANPSVYRRLVALARKAKSKGIRRYSVDALFHVLRWELAISTNGNEKFLLNNDYTAFYARLLMEREPDLRDFFAIRSRRAK